MNIQIKLPVENSIELRSKDNLPFEELVARFCYAAATVPKTKVIAMIELLEACHESPSIASTNGFKSNREQ